MTTPAQDEAIRAVVARLHPEFTAAGREDRLGQIVRSWVGSGRYSRDPVHRASEDAVMAWWREPTAANARRYADALLPVIRLARRREERPAPDPGYPWPEEPRRCGPYLLDCRLGHGGDGLALGGWHVDTGAPVTVKIPCRADGLVWRHLDEGRDWHPALLRVLGWGPPDPPGITVPWVARERADTTLHAVLRERGVPPADEALRVFRAACAGVAFLHGRHVYRWSAHSQNVFGFREGDGYRWVIGDLGRCSVFLPPLSLDLDLARLPYADALLHHARRVDPAFAFLDGAEERLCADWLADYADFGHPTVTRQWPYHEERERRLRLDDCSMLGGLLCQLLGGSRWGWFWKALAKQPYASARYALTGGRRTDDALSAVLNRCWRGDAGGALLAANDGRGEQTTYDDALALLQDVEAALR